MNEALTCHCGLYCGNCAVKATVEPTAALLYTEMKRAGFEEIIDMMPNGGAFWTFLKSMAEEGTCVSCRDGGGNPGCAIRICARERGAEMCVSCAEYPCGKFEELFAGYPVLGRDNALLRDKGPAAWAELQDARRRDGITYSDLRDSEGESAS